MHTTGKSLGQSVKIITRIIKNTRGTYTDGFLNGSLKNGISGWFFSVWTIKKWLRFLRLSCELKKWTILHAIHLVAAGFLKVKNKIETDLYFWWENRLVSRFLQSKRSSIFYIWKSLFCMDSFRANSRT